MTLIERDADAAVRAAQKKAAFEFVAALVKKPPEAAWSTTGSDLQFIGGHEDGVGTTYHESGTLWLGEDPDSSVTDVHGRFHHVSNAFCVDQSIFPTVGSANPVPTGLALSNMVARHIVSRFTSSPLVPLEDKFVSLFDGTLDQWDRFGGGIIQALPGMDIIECGSPAANSTLGFIRTKRKFKNFVLRLDWKAFDIRANSGIFVRMPDVDGDDLHTCTKTPSKSRSTRPVRISFRRVTHNGSMAAACTRLARFTGSRPRPAGLRKR